MSDYHITIHGHFYQPPRENPWLEAIEGQESAHPYHDWNARITAECYAPNAWSRILDGEGRITGIVNNYERISFNIGPTLLAWMEAHARPTYGQILAADRHSAERFSGHGNAIAQPYNHMIMPLANTRDRMTQVRWGIADFEHRFDRFPEGMWLPETAVDVETLEILASEGIRFTILAPHQAARVRPIGSAKWDDVTGSRIDRGRAYVQNLPSGRSIVLFFYDGPIARAVAFERLLDDGQRFADRLIHAFVAEARGPRIVSIATDGESYGHHHHRGEMALSYALKVIEEDESVRLTNYGEYLASHPPEDEVEIVEDTSWSCVHGIERWRSDCGCNMGGRPGWNQAWRAPLREALDELRDALEEPWEAAAREIFADPWGAREAYIEAILDRSDDNLDRWLAEHAGGELTEERQVLALQLLELQRHLMLMYTSCGWFFDELSGIETVQVIQYAGRAVQLASDVFGDGPSGKDLEERFVERLAEAKSNIPQKGDGRRIYEESVLPARVDLNKVAAHYAVTSLFEVAEEAAAGRVANGERPPAQIYAYTVEPADHRLEETGRARLSLGCARIRSVITRNAGEISYAVLHMGDHNVAGGVREFRDAAAYETLAGKITEAFRRADFPAVIRELDESFAAARYSLRSLFRDEQRRILKRILESSVSRAAAQFEQIYENRAPLMRFMADLEIAPPRPFRMAAEFVINTRLRRAIRGWRGDGWIDVDEASRLLDAARREKVELDSKDIAFAARQTLEVLGERFAAAPESPDLLHRLGAATRFLRALPFEVDLWSVQNAYYRVLQDVAPALRGRAEAGDEDARAWVERFEALGEELEVAVAPADERQPA